MKSALQKTTLLALLCFNFTASFAQFQWTFTGGSPGIERTAFNAPDDVYYYESNEHVIFRTEDGVCWDEIPSTVRPIHGSGGVLIGLIENRDAFNNITGKDYYLSYDHGESWTPINSPTVTAYLSPWRYVFASAEALIFVDYPNHLAWVSTIYLVGSGCLLFLRIYCCTMITPVGSGTLLMRE